MVISTLQVKDWLRRHKGDVLKKVVKFLRDFPEIELIGRKLGPFSEGEEVRVRGWEASVLEEKGFVKSVEEFSLTKVRKLLIKEEKNSQLVDIPLHFYRTISRKIERLEEEGRVGDAEEIREVSDSLIKLRVQKLAKMVTSSIKPRDVPPEEVFLANRLFQALKTWRRNLDSLFQETSDKEVGAHEKGIRRSVRGVVGDPADIQE